MKFTHWIALFSQTGSEIVDLSSALNRKPDFVITNANLDEVNSNIEVDFRINNDEAKNLDIFENIEFDTDKTLITLTKCFEVLQYCPVKNYFF